MKKRTLSIAIGLLLAANSGLANKTSQLTLEQRLQQLETRLEAAEQRAAQAESEVQQLKTKQAADIQQIKSAQGNTPVNGQQTVNETKKNAATPNFRLAGYGDLKVYGDVEFNMDAESRKGSLVTNRDDSIEQWDLNGRISLGFDGMRKMADGYYAGFTAQPLADMSGSMFLDDSVFFFGKENDWKIKVGRFEAYDMFPLNQDTFVEHSGNTANDLYDDGHGYIYMMKEGRGRSDAGGNFLMGKTLGNWYFELNTLLEDGTSLYADDGYHGRDMKQEKNVAYLRPVIAWSQDEFSIAAAMESNVINNAYGYYDEHDHFVDQSDRTGYGLTMSWDSLQNNPDNGIVVNLNTAYMDADNEKDFTSAINALWKRFELGYIYAHNKVEDFAGFICDDDCWIDDAGSYELHTIHASYQIPYVMNMKNFNIYLGAYWSKMESDNGSNDDRYGGRIRFKYYF